MVRRTDGTRFAALAASLFLALAVSGCARTVNAGLRLLGLQRAGDGPPVVASVYEHTPSFTWGRYAVGPPAGPARFFQSEGPLAGCSVVSSGLTQVLPISPGASVFGVQHIGFVTVGVAGYGGEVLRQAWNLSTFGLAQGAMQQNAYLSTVDGCSRSLFAFLSLGMRSSFEPIVVR